MKGVNAKVIQRGSSNFPYEEHHKRVEKMVTYLSSYFSPSMLAPNTIAIVKEISEEEFRKSLSEGFVNALAYKPLVTLFRKKFGIDIQLSRMRIQLSTKDTLLCIIPQFQFSRESGESIDVEKAKFQYYRVVIV